MDIVRSSNESIKIKNDNFEFDLEKLKASTLNKLDDYVKRVLIGRVKPGRSETDRRSLSRGSKQAVDRSDAHNNAESPEKRAQTESKKPEYVHPDDCDHYICPAMKKLRTEVCFACGHFATTYNISEALYRSFKARFGFEIDIQYYCPNRLCGSCRSILLSKAGRARQFKFVRPMQWAPASNHLVHESNCDCYFCKADANPDFFREKNRANLPQLTTCVLPEMIADVQVKVDEDEDEWTTYYPAARSANADMLPRSQMNSTRPDQNGLSTNCCSIAELKNEIVQMKEDLLFFCDKLDKKLDGANLHKEMEEIKNQQNVIVNTISFTNILLLQKSQQQNGNV